MKIAYTMSRFPKITETFVLYEIVAMERAGAEVEIFPLIHEKQPVQQPEAKALVERAHYHPFLSWSIVKSNLRALFRAPSTYLGALAEVLGGTFGSLNFFTGAIGVFPKAVHFAHLMEERGVEHLHAHFANHPTVVALIVHRLTGIPFSFTAHGHDLHVERRMLGEKIAASAFAVTISEYNRRLMQEECGPEHAPKVHVLHCGADTDAFSPRPPARNKGPIRLITIGSFIEVKGHRYLVDAVRILKERGIDVRAELIGTGRAREALENRIAEAGVTEQFILHGAQPRPYVIERLRAADIAVQPSVPTERGSREGIPVSLMEAMATGLPTIASKISGIPELVVDGETGHLIPPRDATALADTIARLAADPAERDRLGAAGRERVLDLFDLQRNAERLLTEMRRVAGAATTPGPSSEPSADSNTEPNTEPNAESLDRPKELIS